MPLTAAITGSLEDSIASVKWVAFRRLRRRAEALDIGAAEKNFGPLPVDDQARHVRRTQRLRAPRPGIDDIAVDRIRRRWSMVGDNRALALDPDDVMENLTTSCASLDSMTAAASYSKCTRPRRDPGSAASRVRKGGAPPLGDHVDPDALRS